ncbi:cupin domain-containing protein [Sphingomonas sp.]|uniref:cupin domain-containing protein n=1 Tax=Sphingomonas sp. TaxID=28214 RepID=UPI0025D460CE|nr:cupin domain-containing protein [Sphingomonas sp.]
MIGSADELLLVCEELVPALDRLREQGARLDVIYPADEPHTAILDLDGRTVRLTTRPHDAPPGDLGGFIPEFILTRAGASPGEGRAGMLYRDLIPSRLGGRYIASHITIPHGGPVSDWVHFHRVAFQLIVVRRGWVKVVYEDQGEPFIMQAGDLVVQPPTIRHRVLESSPGLEVVELGCPALHETVADHQVQLPTGRIDPARNFGGQRFLRHVASGSPWTTCHGYEAQATGVKDATNGLADVQFVRPGESTSISLPSHGGELQFGFILEGSARLDRDGPHPLGPADAFIIPPGETWSLSELSPDLRLLHVSTAKSA